ncbi:hypothetical protein MMC14_005011 [Varicellaria rhodocarpa]|nr:hypothetical protein [Varicellaria rhodocarpa]
MIAAHAPEMDEELLDRITLAAEELLQRQLEYKHLHSVATANEEAATEKILQLELEIEDLEKDVTNDQTELTYLKLKLRILEIQTLPYVPVPEKDSLSRGIKVWKQDWADVENRFRVRWKRKGPQGAKGKQGCTLSAKYGI